MNRTPLSLVIMSAFLAAMWTVRIVQIHSRDPFIVFGCILLWAFFAVHLVRYIKQKRDQ